MATSKTIASKSNQNGENMMRFTTLLPYKKEEELKRKSFIGYAKYLDARKKLIESMCEEFSKAMLPLFDVQCRYLGYGIRITTGVTSNGGIAIAIKLLRYDIARILGVEYEEVGDEQQLTFEELSTLFEVIESWRFNEIDFRF